jgi:hypothetical protein
MTHLDPSLNALLHGGAAQTLFIPGEDPKAGQPSGARSTQTRIAEPPRSALPDESLGDFYLLLDQSFALHQPANPQDSALVYDSVHARWHFNRRTRVQSTYELHLHTRQPDITQWTPADLHQLNLFDRYKTQAERAFRRALLNVQAIRKEAVREEHWRALLAIQKQRVDLQRDKFEFAKAKHQAANAPPAADLIQKLDGHQPTLAPIQHDPALNCSVIVQRSFIRLQDGATVIDQISPTHHAVRKFIEDREQFTHPPQLLVRYFTFLNEIPAEYRLFLPDGFRRDPAAPSCVRVAMEFDQYLVLAQHEDIQIASQPAPDTDEEDLSDEDWLAAQRKLSQ